MQKEDTIFIVHGVNTRLLNQEHIDIFRERHPSVLLYVRDSNEVTAVVSEIKEMGGMILSDEKGIESIDFLILPYRLVKVRYSVKSKLLKI